jgi:glycosyltransferase involved in cell wall biosynthesis
MKVIQAVSRYFPDPCGGIQIHLKALVPALKALGVQSLIAASQDAPTASSYRYKGTAVYRYPVFPPPPAEPNHGSTPHGGFAHFATWVSQQNADIYHQHQWNPQCGLPHLRWAKTLGLKTVVTLHLAQPICQRLTLLHQGQTPCDGRIDPVRCSRCAEPLAKALPDPALHLLSQIPTPWLERLPLPRSACVPPTQPRQWGSYLRPLVVPAHIAARRRSLLEIAELSDRIVVVCDWLYQALLANGLPPEKLVLCRCGVPEFFVQQAAAARRFPVLSPRNAPLRVAYLGRWHRDKGIHRLVEAVQALPPSVPVDVTIHGIANDDAYRHSVLKQINGDPRLRIAAPLSREEMPAVLATFDVVAVPSQCLETGPLVVLEAHALGIPVVGSAMGGIAELVNPGVDGLLVPPQDSLAWAAALQRLACDRAYLHHLRQGIRPVRTIQTESQELVSLYHHLLGNALPGPSSLAPRPLVGPLPTP